MLLGSHQGLPGMELDLHSDPGPSPANLPLFVSVSRGRRRGCGPGTTGPKEIDHVQRPGPRTKHLGHSKTPQEFHFCIPKHRQPRACSCFLHMREPGEPLSGVQACWTGGGDQVPLLTKALRIARCPWVGQNRLGWGLPRFSTVPQSMSHWNNSCGRDGA